MVRMGDKIALWRLQGVKYGGLNGILWKVSFDEQEHAIFWIQRRVARDGIGRVCRHSHSGTGARRVG